MAASDSFRLDGQTALVTGASRGLGRRFAKVLAAAGARVAMAARTMSRLEEARDEVAAEGGEACAIALDVTDAGSVRAAFDEVEARLGTVGVLINNAGVAVSKPLLEIEEADWDHVLDTNLKGAWLVAQEAARRMIAADAGGSIVNIASVLGLRAAGSVVPYCAAKAGLIHLTRAMALELARHDIRVNGLAPGYIETEINRDFFASDAGQRLIKRIPQGRLGRPRDLDGALLLLASDASSFMTGEIIAVDGGHLVSSL